MALMNDTCFAPVALFTAGRSAASFADIVLVEHDCDCADALEVLLAGLPGVRDVRVVSSAREALVAVQRGRVPDAIFLNSSEGTYPLIDDIRSLRHAAPEAALVLLCVYPEALRADVAELVDAAITKDTCRRDLELLLDRLGV